MNVRQAVEWPRSCRKCQSESSGNSNWLSAKARKWLCFKTRSTEMTSLQASATFESVHIEIGPFHAQQGLFQAISQGKNISGEDSEVVPRHCLERDRGGCPPPIHLANGTGEHQLGDRPPIHSRHPPSPQSFGRGPHTQPAQRP